MAVSVLDRYTQWAVLSVLGTVSTDNTVVGKLETGLSNLQKLAWEVYAMEFYIPAAWDTNTILAARADYLRLGLTQSGNVLQIGDPDNPSLVESVTKYGPETLTAVGVLPRIVQPDRVDYRESRLVLPQYLYAFLDWHTSANLTANKAFIRLHYKEVELGPQDWYDLLQMRMPLGAV